MQLISHSLNTPEENIAFDELMLTKAENGEVGETVRFWTSKDYFVVVGRGGKVTEDCNLDQCFEDGVKIIRRVSGGGTVLQGPGCMNFSIVLSYERDEMLKNIHYSYRHVLETISKALSRKGHPVELLPISDLTLFGKKISGNAQARKKKYFLHHGTLLYDFDLGKIGLYVKHPKKEPDYRKRRDHINFVSNINLSEDDLKSAVLEAFPPFGITLKVKDTYLEEVRQLVDTKYKDIHWNFTL